MAYVNGKLGETIQELMDESNIEYDNGDYIKSIDLLIEAWDKLPDDKVQYDESYLIIWVEYLFVLPVTKSWKKSLQK